MAELISQKEIDELLKGTITESEEAVNEALGEKQIPMGKTYHYPKKKGLRFETIYVSPVEKAENLIYNPDPTKPEPENRVVVRSLENYNKFKKHY